MNQILETPAVQKRGGMQKCPSCGASLGAFVAHCESCGHEFLDVDANRSITALAARFEEIEDEIDALGLKGTRREKALVERKASVIRDFPVPNSREDLQQLIYYIQPRIVASVKPDPNVEDWRAKFAEVLNRAKNAYKNDDAALAEFGRIEASLNSSLADNLQIKARRNPLFFALLGGVVILGAVAFFSAQRDQASLAECEQAYVHAAAAETSRLNTLQSAIRDNLRTRDVAGAQATLLQVRWDYAAPCKLDENARLKADWQEKAQQLDALIRSTAQQQAAAGEVAASRAAAEQQASANRASAERISTQNKVAELARIEADKQKAVAAGAATAARKASTEQQW